MLREIKGTQRLPRFLAFKLTGTGTAALTEGALDATLVDNGTGDYTLTFTKPFARAPAVTVGCRSATTNVKLHSVSATAIQIKTFAVDGTTAADALLDLHVLGWDTPDQY